MKRSYLGLLLYVLAIIFILGIVLSNETAQAQSGGGYRFVTQWGSATEGGYFHQPCGIALDASGNMYVIDMQYNRVQKFSFSGSFITKWGLLGSGNGQFSSPHGIAVDNSGNVYVADSDNHRIQIFSSEGVFLKKLGSYGIGEGQFIYPYGIVVDNSGNIYVADSDNHRIQKFSSEGVFLKKWGSQGSGEGQFQYPEGMAVDASGNIYVADTWNHRIQKFSSAGDFIAQWGSYGFDDGQFALPNGIAVDATGNFYVVSSRIQKFSSDGVFIAGCGSYGSGDNQFISPSGVTIDASGDVYVTAFSFVAGYGCIQKYSSSGSFITQWGSQGSEDGLLNAPLGVSVDTSGYIYVSNGYNGCIQKYSSSGSFITKWNSLGTAYGVVVDASGNVYVADSGSHQIRKFSSSGNLITQWGSYGIGEGQFNYPNGIAVDVLGNVYVVDRINHRIQKFSSEGVFITQWGSYGIGEGQFKHPDGIAVDASGNVYVTDWGNHRIQKFSSSGNFIANWGPFYSMEGIAVDTSGNIYITDSGNKCIRKLSSTGSFITQWGSLGSGDGQFDFPRGIAVDSAGNVYVSDSDNWIVQKFAPLPSAGANNNLYFPHMAASDSWRTEIAIINAGDRIAAGMLRAFSDEGRLIEAKDIALSAHGRRQIDVAAEFADHADIGYIIFETNSVDLQGYAKFYREGVYRAAVPAVKVINTSDIFIPHIASDARWWTRLCLLNTTPESKEWTILFSDGQTRNIMLNAHEQRSFDIASLFDNQPQPDIESAVIFNAKGIIGLEIFGSTDGNLLEGIPLTDKMASTLYYPHVAGDGWWTGIVANNPSDLACTITVTPYSVAGTPLTTTILPIAGKGKYVGAISALDIPAETTWFRIDSSRPLTGFALFSPIDNQQLAAYAGGGGIGAKEGVFPKIEKNGWTDIAFVNTEATKAYVSLTAYDDNGTPVDGRAFIVHGYAKVVKPVEELFLHDISGATYIAYSSDRNIVGFQLNGSADGTMLDGLPALGSTD